jgi:glutathione S-transferase
MRLLAVATSWLACVPRFPMGMWVHAELGPRPAQRLVLYEFEGCPFCRKVREALTMLDLSVEVRPCPKGGPSFRPELVQRGGRSQFPYLIDPNQGVELYESDDIIAHLYQHYGAGSPPLLLRLGPLTTLASALAGLWRPGFGSTYREARRPQQPLELYSFEISPFCRLAREALSELELPYILHNVGKNSPGRPAFRELSGRMMVPYLVDPNTGAGMHESADIVAYLERTYGGAA